MIPVATYHAGSTANDPVTRNGTVPVLGAAEKLTSLHVKGTVVTVFVHCADIHHVSGLLTVIVRE